MAKNTEFYQDVFIPRNPSKYVGDVNKITYRSAWERDFKVFLDGNPNIIRWASEQVVVDYVKPTDGRIHKYYVDYWVEYVDKNGAKKCNLIELKPYNQTIRPKPSQGKKTQTYMNQLMLFEVNQAKWAAADRVAKHYNWTFTVMTERELYGDMKVTKQPKTGPKRSPQKRKINTRRNKR